MVRPRRRLTALLNLLLAAALVFAPGEPLVGMDPVGEDGGDTTARILAPTLQQALSKNDRSLWDRMLSAESGDQDEREVPLGILGSSLVFVCLRVLFPPSVSGSYGTRHLRRFSILRRGPPLFRPV